jgi:hypothetical protein
MAAMHFHRGCVGEIGRQQNATRQREQSSGAAIGKAFERTAAGRKIGFGHHGLEQVSTP